MRYTLPIFAVLSIFLEPCHGQGAAKSAPREEVDVGGRKIKLPPPAGFARIDGLNPGVDRAVESVLPATNRYLARFEPIEPNAADTGRMFNAQVLRSLENREIGERTFAETKQQTKEEIDMARESIRREVEKQAGNASKKMEDATGADLALSVGDVAVLGFFDDSPNSLGFTIAMNIAAKVGGKAIKRRTVVASLVVPVNGRLIYLYANADFKSAEDRQWAEKAVMDWGKTVLAVNPRVQGPPGRTSIFDGIGRSALIGAVVGGAVALLAMVFRKKRQS